MKVTAKYDAAYEAWRNALIPLAEARADAYYPEPAGAVGDERERWSFKWDAAFHRAMAELTSDPFRSQEVN